MSIRKLVVMVSAYNSGVWIQNRLENLLQSSIIHDMEIWCVNADSPDPRDDIIPQRYPIKYIKLPQRNTVYEAWNYIIQHSDSPYLATANTDDIVSPICYETLLAAFDRDPSIDFSYPSWYTTAVPNQSWKKLQSHTAVGGRPGRYSGDLTKAGVGHFPIWKRGLHDQLGLLDTSFKALADAEWWARCYFKAKSKFEWYAQPLACYLWREGENLWHKSVNEDEWANYHGKVAKYKAETGYTG